MNRIWRQHLEDFLMSGLGAGSDFKSMSSSSSGSRVRSRSRLTDHGSLWMSIESSYVHEGGSVLSPVKDRRPELVGEELDC